MSSERFDKLMKKNLEAVKPSYQPRAWDRFRKRLPLSGFWPWMMHYGGWVVSGLMLSGWLVTLYALQENKQMMQQLSQRLASTARPADLKTGVSETQPGALRRVDTVYIVKRTIVEHRHFYRPIEQKTAFAGTVARTDSSDGITNGTEEYRTKNDTRATENRSRIHANAKQRFSEANRRTAFSKSGKPTDPALPVDDRSTTPADSAQTNSTTDRVEAEKIADNQTIPVQSDRQKTAPPDSVEQKTAVVPAPLQPEIKKIEPKRSPFRLSSLRPRIGIETMVTRNSVGAGPAIEVFPTENLGISVGLQASQLRSENHRGLKDFNSATGKEFIEQYRPYLPAQYDRIEEIAIKTSGVSLPISLKYYVPLRPKWSLVFQTGTTLDLASYQQIRYESYYRGEEAHHSFDLNFERHLFHNFMFGAGIQFHQSRISGQLIPFYLYDFRNISNTPTGSSFGLKASVWLDLFK